jgi:hypothetical protein
MTKNTKLLLLTLFLSTAGFIQIKAQQPVSFEDQEEQLIEYYMGLNVRYYPYQSFSLIKPSFPLQMGYPSYVADVIALGLDFERRGRTWDHYMSVKWSVPAAVSSDDGNRRNILIKPGESSLNRFQYQYFFTLPLITAGETLARFGGSSSFVYEKRELTFVSGRTENQWDIGAGLGPVFSLYFPLLPSLAFHGQYHLLFYLPYFSYGEWESQHVGSPLLSSIYYPFIFSTHWELKSIINPAGDFQLQIGYRKTDQVGFGNSTPSFTFDENVIHKLERYHEFFFGVILKIGN